MGLDAATHPRGARSSTQPVQSGGVAAFPLGKTRHRRTYDDTYAHHQCEPWYATHPAALTVREDAIDPFVARFFHERIFGAHRLTYLGGPGDDVAVTDHTATVADLARQLADLDAAHRNLIAALQQMTSSGDTKIDAQWRSQLQARFTANTKRRQAVTAEAEALAKAVRQPTALLDRPPHVNLDVLDLPSELQRQLFDAFQLGIRYDRRRQQVTIKVALRADMIDSLGRSAVELAENTHAGSTPPGLTDRADGAVQAARPAPVIPAPAPPSKA